MEAFTLCEDPFNYATNMPYDGWRQFLLFLIETYKNGTAIITKEGVQTWYRIDPKNVCTSGGTTVNTASQLQLEFAPSEVVEDKVYYSLLLGSSANVFVTIGGTAQAGTWSDVPDGDISICHGSVPFNGATGSVIVTVSRSRNTIASVNGTTITTNCTNGINNWNARVGAADFGRSISASPALNLADQVCIEETGAYNSAGICSFGCQYGYW